MRKSIFVINMLAAAWLFAACTQQQDKEETVVQEATEAPQPVVDIAAEEAAVKKVLWAYKSALERLDVSGTDSLFASDSEIIETGKVEGTYADYLDHHIGPELGHFKSFTFENYQVRVQVAGEYAFTTETYNYVIVLQQDERVIERQGVATSVLHKQNGSWKILKAHNSSRPVKKQ